MRRLHAIVITILLAAITPAPGTAQERHAVGGSHVAIFNLAGTVQVRSTSGGQVTVDVTRGGRDGGQLRVETGSIEGRQTLRVVYPGTRVVYGAGRGNTQVSVRPDGTWGRGRGGRNVRVASSGSGTEAHADLVIGVPRGQRADIYLAVGRITAENVDGTIRLDTHAGGVTARGMSGSLVVDTGSGSVEVSGMQGSLNVDTGSGSVRVSDVNGDEMIVDTGSGRVVAENVTAQRVVIDTGSGSIDLRRGSARDVRLDTGSGSVNAELGGAIDRLIVDTGSGGVTLALPRDLDASLHIDTGSGGISVEHAVRVTRQSRRELQGVVGNGRGTVRIDTGSGSVRIRTL